MVSRLLGRSARSRSCSAAMRLRGPRSDPKINAKRNQQKNTGLHRLVVRACFSPSGSGGTSKHSSSRSWAETPNRFAGYAVSQKHSKYCCRRSGWLIDGACVLLTLVATALVSCATRHSQSDELPAQLLPGRSHLGAVLAGRVQPEAFLAFARPVHVCRYRWFVEDLAETREKKKVGSLAAAFVGGTARKTESCMQRLLPRLVLFFSCLGKAEGNNISPFLHSNRTRQKKRGLTTTFSSDG